MKKLFEFLASLKLAVILLVLLLLGLSVGTIIETRQGTEAAGRLVYYSGWFLGLQGLLAVNAPSQMGSDESQAISEVVADDGESPEQAMLDAGDGPFVRSLLDNLDERERKILELRFALDGYEGPPRTFKQIGAMVGLTRERVRQLETQARAKLKLLLDEE